mmetsp:Transcript_10198/g.30649  ORF Transcript_10198/g.30649 Transcript_10198/m.30649 type:complete len:226 (-) Transcript_10198:752-1429(-)
MTASPSRPPGSSSWSNWARSESELKLRPISRICVSIVCVQLGSERLNSSTSFDSVSIFGSSSSSDIIMSSILLASAFGLLSAWAYSSAAATAASNSKRRDTRLAAVPTLSMLQIEWRLCVAPVWTKASQAVTQSGLRCETWSVLSCKSMSRLEFISAWKCSSGRSLSSLPKGFSNCPAAALREKEPKMGTNVKRHAKTQLPLISEAIIRGVNIRFTQSKVAISCA